MKQPTLRILSLGAGRQSTALFILGCEGKLLPRLDAAIFADTQWEPRHVMDHLASLQRFGEEHGVPVYLASKGSLPQDVLDRHVFATLPAWTKSSPWEYVPSAFGPCPSCQEAPPDPGTLFGTEACADCGGTLLVPVKWEKRLRKAREGRIRRQCTPKYKIEIIDSQVRVLLGAQVWEEPCRYCKAAGERIAPWDPEAGLGPCSICRGTGMRRRTGPVPAGAASEQWVGFSTDEFDRVNDSTFPAYEIPRYPLLELGWTVERCQEFNTSRGWQSEKSACIGCPLHDDGIWIDMKRREPSEFAAAVAFDAAFRTAPGLADQRYLHESRLPLDVAVARAEQRQHARGEQSLLVGQARRRQPRGCSPYGCRSGRDAYEETGGEAA